MPIDWHNLMPPLDAKAQTSWERRRMAARMRQAGLTFVEIGTKFGVGPERARQIVAAGERAQQSLLRHPSFCVERFSVPQFPSGTMMGRRRYYLSELCNLFTKGETNCFECGGDGD